MLAAVAGASGRSAHCIRRCPSLRRPSRHAPPSRRALLRAGGAIMAASVAADAAADAAGAFIVRLELEGAQDGPLQGRTVGVKDNFDLQGYKTGAGNPTWLDTHPPATATAPAVQALLDAGARVVGKTHMDELAYSLNGENAHYGTPRNAAAPGRIPGGSSSGSAAAAGGGLVDIGLGSDTAGSVRVPASYNGLLGFRPTHARVSLELATPLAPSFDTAGWFARDAATLKATGQVLLAGSPSTPLPSPRWLVATDAFDLSDDATRQAIYDAMSVDFPAVTAVLGPPKELAIASLEGEGSLEQWLDVFRVIQAHEVWQAHGEWVRAAAPAFGPGVKERFEAASKVTAAEVEDAAAARERIVAHVLSVLGSDGLLALPTCPGPAPLLNTPTAELELFRRRLLSLSALAPLCCLPQVTLPIAEVDGCPVGLSLIGPRGTDEALLEVAEALMAAMPAARGAASA
mmetsp:Transcript_21304/g.54631  ORF Transcript_21304/g.54631 Transcript_21304/m.54631 type:complete len:460 (+) Transcript_21304:139-1518(+)